MRSLADVYTMHTSPAVLNQLAATLTTWVRADFSRSREAEAVFTEVVQAVVDRVDTLLRAKAGGRGRASGLAGLPRGMDMDVSLRASFARLHYLARYWDLATIAPGLQPR